MRTKYLNDLYYSGPQKESRKEKYKAKLSARHSRFHHVDDLSGFGGFTCARCGLFVSTDTLLSGVNNRNHCPYCLWSRHLDLFTPGDRLSACKARMQPVGLTFKKSRNKYALEPDGEVMLVHLCTECAHISINRTAADDDPSGVLALLKESPRLDSYTCELLTASGIRLLDETDALLVRARLLGRN
jgi:hypothetical protein